MLSENYQEKTDIYTCNTCNYNCSDKSNYNKHLNTIKHKRLTDANANTTKNTTNNATQYECKCGKKYRHCASLSRHKLNCKNIEPANPNSKESLILELIAQNKELMTLLSSQHQHQQLQQHQQQQQQQQHKEETKCLVETIQEQSATMQQTIKDIIPKIGNNNNNTTNNKFNLQVFLNEDCKDAINFSEFIENIQVTVEDLENQAQLGYVGGISKMFIENMKELGVNRRPIHCTDKKRNTLYIKENNEWDKEGSREQLLHGIKVITGRANQTLCDMKEDNPVEYSDMDSAFSAKCEDIHRNLLPVFPREATFGKVIDSISNGSVVEKEP
jgi:hypothetical protein